MKIREKHSIVGFAEKIRIGDDVATIGVDFEVPEDVPDLPRRQLIKSCLKAGANEAYKQLLGAFDVEDDESRVSVLFEEMSLKEYKD